MDTLFDGQDRSNAPQDVPGAGDSIGEAVAKLLKLCNADKVTVIRNQCGEYTVSAIAQSGRDTPPQGIGRTFADGGAMHSLLEGSHELFGFRAEATPFTELDCDTQSVYILGLRVQENPAGFVVIEYRTDYRISDIERGHVYQSAPYFESLISGEADGHVQSGEAIVLVVDDVRTNLMVAQRLLDACGIRADLATSGFEALELVQTTDYDLIFMDNMMPEMDGFETARRLRQLGGKFRSLPIIAFTADMTADSAENLSEAGMNDFIAKPVEREKLIAILEKWLPPNKMPSCADVGSTVTGLSPLLAKAGGICGLDIGLALERLGGAVGVLEDLFRQSPRSLGEQTANAGKLLDSGKLHEFTVEIHGLKSSLATIGAMQLSELAFRMEHAAKGQDMRFCADRFPPFAAEAAALVEKLESVFSEESPGKEAGSLDVLVNRVSVALSCLEDFEADLAAEHLGEAMKYTFNETIDNTLTEACGMLDSFDCVSAAEILKNLI